MATSSEPRPFRESTTEEVGLSTKRQLLKWKRMFADDTDDSWVADEHHASFGDSFKKIKPMTASIIAIIWLNK